MHNEFTAVFERDGEWYIAYSPEIPGANGQGRSLEECRENLREAIALILEDRREEGLRGVPEDADERRWDDAFARSQPKLARVANQVREDVRAGRTRDSDIEWNGGNAACGTNV